MKRNFLGIVGAFTVFAGVGVIELSAQEDPPVTLRIKGSDTMLQMNLQFASQYPKARPMKKVEVDGQGSSTGFRALIDGSGDIACSSRPIKESEKAKIKEKSGEDPVEHVVAYDAIAVMVHAKSALDSMSLETLKGIFFEGGKIDRWDQVPGSKGSMGDIELVGRANNSGTYAAFQQMVAGRGLEYKKGVAAIAGSVALVERVGSFPRAIGYASPAYATAAVKMLKLAVEEADAPAAATAENMRSGNYPLTRKLYYYTAGKPEGEVKAFLDWLESAEAKKIIGDMGFVAP